MKDSSRIDRRVFQRTTALGALGCLGARLVKAKAAGTQATTTPNIVLIMADDLGFETIGANGSASYSTPRLDELARTGARFTNCHVNPLCTPTRTAIMTGRFNFRNYVGFGLLAPGEKTFAHMLKEAGYATAAVGKWQLELGPGTGQTPTEAGFDEYCLWNVRFTGRVVHGDRYADPNLLFWDRATKRPTFRKFNGEYGPDVCKNYLFEFMESAVGRKQPFLAYFPMILTHSPFQPTPASPEWAKGDRRQSEKPFFKDMIEYMDTIVDEVEDKLTELGIREETLLIFLGDNGSGRGLESRMQDGAEIVGAKGFLTDGGTHVPLIANWPGTIPAGQLREELVGPTDFLATLAEATGTTPLDPPGDGLLDSVSFLPQLKGKTGTPRDWLLIEYFEDRDIFRNCEGRFVRNRRWKLYAEGVSPFHETPFFKAGQLYDLQSDPNEENPIPAIEDGSEAAAVRKRFLAVLDRHRKHAAARTAR